MYTYWTLLAHAHALALVIAIIDNMQSYDYLLCSIAMMLLILCVSPHIHHDHWILHNDCILLYSCHGIKVLAWSFTD